MAWADTGGVRAPHGQLRFRRAVPWPGRDGSGVSSRGWGTSELRCGSPPSRPDGKKILRPPCFITHPSLWQLPRSAASCCSPLPPKGLGILLPHVLSVGVPIAGVTSAIPAQVSPYTQPAPPNSPATTVTGQPQAFLQYRSYISGRLPFPPQRLRDGMGLVSPRGTAMLLPEAVSPCQRLGRAVQGRGEPS